MEKHRHFTGIGREADVPAQNMQHFMSNSPWSGATICAQVQQELQATPELTTGGVLLVDESADEKAGDKSAGSAKQYNGRLGKVETSQVGVFLSYVNLKVAQGFWTWIAGKLFLPEAWFDPSHHALRKRLCIPESLIFKTKIELAWDLIKEAIDRNLPFEIIGYDTLYGRDASAGSAYTPGYVPRYGMLENCIWQKCPWLPRSILKNQRWVSLSAKENWVALLHESEY